MQQNASGERKEEVRIEMRTRALVQRYRGTKWRTESGNRRDLTARPALAFF